MRIGDWSSDVCSSDLLAPSAVQSLRAKKEGARSALSKSGPVPRPLETLLALVEIAIMLDQRDAQSGHAAAVDRPLPAGKFLEGQPIAFARLVDGQEPAVHGRADPRLAEAHTRRRRPPGTRTPRPR